MNYALLVIIHHHPSDPSIECRPRSLLLFTVRLRHTRVISLSVSMPPLLDYYVRLQGLLYWLLVY